MITGASGVIYGVRALEVLRRLGVETRLVMSRSAQVTLGYEAARKAADMVALADVSYRPQDGPPLGHRVPGGAQG
jgi:flavin prenyltransferase